MFQVGFVIANIISICAGKFRRQIVIAAILAFVWRIFYSSKRLL